MGKIEMSKSAVETYVDGLRVDDAKLRTLCRRLLRRYRVPVVAFYANPKFSHVHTPDVPAHPPLDSLTRDMQYIMQTLSPVDVSVQACGDMSSMISTVRTLNPKVLIFSGHGFRDGLIFERRDRWAQVVSAEALAPALAHPSLEVVVLLACETHRLVHALPDLFTTKATICFDTVAEDGPLSTYSEKIYEELADQLERGDGIDAMALLLSGIEEFKTGNPMWQLKGPQKKRYDINGPLEQKRRKHRRPSFQGTPALYHNGLRYDVFRKTWGPVRHHSTGKQWDVQKRAWL